MGMESDERRRKATKGDETTHIGSAPRTRDSTPYSLIISGFLLVDGAGLEPAASALRTRRETRFP